MELIIHQLPAPLDHATNNSSTAPLDHPSWKTSELPQQTTKVRKGLMNAI
jgi:hypothetical protein